MRSQYYQIALKSIKLQFEDLKMFFGNFGDNCCRLTEKVIWKFEDLKMLKYPDFLMIRRFTLSRQGQDIG